MLNIPLLPYQVNGKQVFSCCRKCSEQQSYRCGHSGKQRGFTGCYTTDELDQALELGYQVKKTFISYHHKERNNAGFK